MAISDAVNIEDLHRMAKHRLPKIVADWSRLETSTR